ncbi:hypothetical protein GGR56DRAFT_632235 [Xylariaceae sp. FL0804]|nr:hypothetical protein GGR56DRAFT_632235 [Xylariaceae sp. FL0804]
MARDAAPIRRRAAIREESLLRRYGTWPGRPRAFRRPGAQKNRRLQASAGAASSCLVWKAEGVRRDGPQEDSRLHARTAAQAPRARAWSGGSRCVRRRDWSSRGPSMLCKSSCAGVVSSPYPRASHYSVNQNVVQLLDQSGTVVQLVPGLEGRGASGGNWSSRGPFDLMRGASAQARASSSGTPRPEERSFPNGAV